MAGLVDERRAELNDYLRSAGIIDSLLELTPQKVLIQLTFNNPNLLEKYGKDKEEGIDSDLKVLKKVYTMLSSQRGIGASL
jgi:hypothetical protein